MVRVGDSGSAFPSKSLTLEFREGFTLYLKAGWTARKININEHLSIFGNCSWLEAAVSRACCILCVHRYQSPAYLDFRSGSAPELGRPWTRHWAPWASCLISRDSEWSWSHGFVEMEWGLNEVRYSALPAVQYASRSSVHARNWGLCLGVPSAWEVQCLGKVFLDTRRPRKLASGGLEPEVTVNCLLSYL